METPLLASMLATVQLWHDDYVSRNRAVFLELPPDDRGIYVYTYYDGTDYPLYHGYTTDAQQRAETHLKKAPWASWTQDVRYRECGSPQQARKLESRLHRKVESMCGNGTGRGGQLTHHGEDWSVLDREYKINHVTGTCRLPGGACDPAHLSQLAADALNGAS
jgi:predicted GIY-YIG superfamily endonuclease